MIAKQSKPSISNKIHEKSIKNTKPAPSVPVSSVGASASREEESNKSKDTLAQRHFPNATQAKQNQPNETRSETNQIDRSSPVATSNPGPQSSSSPPSSRPLSSPSQASMALQAASAANLPANATTSLLNASTKIQQRQQKFLAAAAKSATSPQTHHLQRHQPQAVAWRLNTTKLPAPRKAANACVCNGTCCPTSLVPPCCETEASCQNVRSFPALNQQLPSAGCCPLDNMPPVSAADKSVASTDCTGVCAANQQVRQSLVSTGKSNVQVAGSVSGGRMKTMRVADGAACDKASDRTMSGDMSNYQRPLQQRAHSQPQARIATTDSNACGPIDCASAKIARSAAAPDCEALSENSPVASINSADICREAVAEQRSIVDGNENGCEYRHYPQQLSHHHHHHHHHHLNHHHNHHLKHQQQQQTDIQSAEVRRSCENNEFKDEKDKININHQKDTFKQQQHFHQNHNSQQVYPQLQYQPAQQILTSDTPQNQSKSTSVVPHLPQQAMAHYKFHNDCQSSVLTYEQVKRLDFVMDQVVPVHGRGNAPTLYVKLKELIRSVKHKLHEHSIEIRDVRLNGGASNFVLAPENSHYNDLDLILGTDLSNEDRFDVIRDVVLECLMEFYPKEDSQQQAEHVQANADQDENKPGGHISETSMMANLQIANQEARLIGEDVRAEESSSRSDRSFSFESDNLNITNNGSDDASINSEGDDSDDDEQDNIVVTIDSDEDLRARKSAGSGPEVTNSKTLEVNVERPAKGPSAEYQEASDVATNTNGSQQVNAQALQYQQLQMPLNKCAIKEAYVHKMVKVNDDDRWSLISLGVQPSETNNYNHMQPHKQKNQLTEISEKVTLCCADAKSASSSSSHKNQQSIGFCQQSQMPNSIELKFVDRMRRKFEFSVDSFQIILDSLIQFYDYAPQSTITIQRRLSSFHPSSSFMNSMIGRRASCGQCCGLHMMQQGALHPEADKKDIDKFLDDGNGILMKKKQGKQIKNSSNKEASLNSSRSYYDLPLEPNNSLSNSSVASSSGCSSSSSVVSSSSSSLSCDEDHEDLDCDVDNSPSSSASTSSLLSSTTASLSISSGTDNSCDPRAQLERNDGASSPSAATSPSGDAVGERNSQKSTSVKQVKEHTSKNDCTHSRRCAETECDFETSRLSSCAVISENFYPTVIGRSEYGNFKEALYHLEKKLIATRSPEEIRGGGLLKYCNLLVKNYKPTNVLQIRTLERYMCSRFFIDFSDLNQQRAKLDSYLANHFSDDPMQKYHYLTILHNVVQRSTVCLMNHELRLTLNMIRELAYELNEQQQQQQQSQSQHQSHSTQRRSAFCGQPPLCNQSQSRQQVDQQEAQYQQLAKPTVMQSGVYRVKLVNYALAKPVK